MIGIIFILILVTGLLTTIILYGHTIARNRNKNRHDQLTDAIEELLPQTQCGQCHYAGCRPYARAIASGDADIDQCPPGGTQTIKDIARLLGRDREDDAVRSGQTPAPVVALIDEDICIGCVKCINACPVDAIVGAPKLMHTVIKKYCTGCELCIPPCPVNCISMVPVRVKTREWVWSKPEPDLGEPT